MSEARSLRICMIGSPDSIHTQNRARALAARGHTVTILPVESGLIPNGQGVARILSNLPKIKGLATIYHRLQQLRRLEAEIFHVQYAAGADAWLAAIAGLRPLVVSVWGGDVLFDEQGNPTRQARRLTCDLIATADLVTAESPRMLAAVHRLRPDTWGVLVHWGIDMERFRRGDPGDMRARLGIPAAAPVLYSPRLLQPLYNTHLIVEALVRIKARYPSVRLLIGTYHEDKSYRRRLEDLGAALGVGDHLIFLPVLDLTEIVSIYNLADMVVAIPPSDSMPRSMMEAMACGVPLVLSRIPAHEELVSHRENAYLTSIDPDAVASAVLDLLDDRALSERLRSNGLATAARGFDERAEAARMEAFYHEVLARPRARAPRAKRAVMLFRLLLTFGLKM